MLLLVRGLGHTSVFEFSLDIPQIALPGTALAFENMSNMSFVETATEVIYSSFHLVCLWMLLRSCLFLFIAHGVGCSAAFAGASQPSSGSASCGTGGPGGPNRSLSAPAEQTGSSACCRSSTGLCSSPTSTAASSAYTCCAPATVLPAGTDFSLSHTRTRRWTAKDAISKMFLLKKKF